MSEETTCGDTHRCICSQELGDGASPCEWQAGEMTGQCGADLVLASRFPLPAKEPVQMTLGTFGLTCDDWLQSADHQSSSENKSPAPQLSERLGARLMERLARYGSMEYSLTWKRRVTPAGRLYYQQRASARRISDRDCGGVQSGWLTPQAQVGPHGYRPAGPNGQLDLDRQVLVAGWPPARAEDSESTGAHRGSPDTLTSAAQVSGWPTPRLPGGGMTSADHSDLPGVAALTGWPPPNSANADRGGFATEEGLRERMESGHQKNLQEVVGIAGWCTPNAMDGGQTSRGGDRIGEPLLAGQAQAAGWATPQARDHFPPHSEEYVAEKRDQGHGMRNLSDEALTGATPGSSAATGPRGALNPQFPLWLMGYPEAWATCAPGHQSWATVQEVLSETPDASAKEPCAAQATP